MGNGAAGWRQPPPAGGVNADGGVAAGRDLRNTDLRIQATHHATPASSPERGPSAVVPALRTGYGLSRLPDLGFARTCVSAFQGYTEQTRRCAP